MRPVLRHRGKYFVLDLVVVVGFFATMVSLLRLFHGSFGPGFAQSALVGLLGLWSGILTSVIITPYSVEEDRRWSGLTTAVVGGIAGYGVSILDDSIDWLFNEARVLTDPTVGLRATVFLVCIAFALIYGFSYRRYYIGIDLMERDPSTGDQRDEPVDEMRGRKSAETSTIETTGNDIGDGSAPR